MSLQLNVMSHAIPALDLRIFSALPVLSLFFSLGINVMLAFLLYFNWPILILLLVVFVLRAVLRDTMLFILSVYLAPLGALLAQDRLPAY